jgi:hypothetical protein
VKRQSGDDDSVYEVDFQTATIGRSGSLMFRKEASKAFNTEKKGGHMEISEQ